MTTNVQSTIWFPELLRVTRCHNIQNSSFRILHSAFLILHSALKKILVLVECTVTHILGIWFKGKLYCLNPCFSGMYRDRNQVRECCENTEVLILVLVEYTVTL